MRFYAKLLKGNGMNQETIRTLLTELDTHLEEKLEIVAVGGAAMVLMGAKEQTKDIDAVSKIPDHLKGLIDQIGQEADAPSDWLNDALHGFGELPEDKRQTLWSGNNLTVVGPTKEFQLYLKAESARYEKDLDDVLALTRSLGMTLPEVQSMYKSQSGKPLPQNVYYHLLYSEAA